MNNPKPSPKVSPKVSIVLPVRNGAEFLADAIRSVQNQTVPDWELLIGDDDSGDRTLEIAQGFSDPRIKVFPRKTDLGLFKNCNFLLQHAHGTLIRFLCHDDILEPECLEEEWALFSRYPEVGISYCNVSYVDAAGTLLERGQIGQLPQYIRPVLAQQHFFFHGNILGSQSAVCVRARCFEAHGKFDESFQCCGDYEMWSRICTEECLGILHDRLVKVRQHQLQMSRVLSWGAAHAREKRAVRAAVQARLPAEVRTYSSLYGVLRNNVLEINSVVLALRSGELRVALDIVKALGPLTFLRDSAAWVLTLGTRIAWVGARFVRVDESSGPPVSENESVALRRTGTEGST